MLEYVLLAIVVATAACLQGSIGFGMGLFATPLIALINPGLVPGLVVLLTLPITASVVVRERADVDVPSVAFGLIGRIPGTVLGAWLVTLLATETLALLIGVVVLLGVAISILGWVPQPNRIAVIAAGLISGITGTATSLGGPPMALIWQASKGPRLRGTMNAFFLIGATISAIALLSVGAIDGAIAELALLLFPAIVVGYFMSRLANKILETRLAKFAIHSVSALSAVTLVIIGLL